MRTYRIEKNKINFKFEYNPSIIEKIKEIEGRIYFPNSKEWMVPITIQNNNAIQSIISLFSFEEIKKKNIKFPEPEYNLIDFIPKLKELNLGLQCRPYQEFAVNYMLTYKRVLNGDDCGIGKTLETIFACEVGNLFPVVIVTLSSVKEHWERLWKLTNPNRKIEVLYAEKTDYNWSSDVIILNYNLMGKNESTENEKTDEEEETIKAVFRYPELERLKKKCVVFDESHFCFTYDTLVNTNKGLLKIGEIVECEIDCKVLSYDFVSESFCYSLINDYICLNNFENYIRINVSNKSLICTENHLIYTDNGYKKAKEISCDDKVFILWECSRKGKQRKRYGKILLSILFFKIQLFKSSKKKNYRRKMFNSSTKKTTKNNGMEKLFFLWRSVLYPKVFRKTFLWEKLFGKMENVSTRNKEKSSQQRSKRESSIFYEKTFRAQWRKSSTDKKEKFRENEVNESNDGFRKYRKNEINKKKKWYFRFDNKQQRWKWKIYRTSIKVIRRIIKNRIKSYIGIAYKYVWLNERIQNSNKLQIRYWVKKLYDFYRNRWVFSSKQKTETKRYEKRFMFKFERVENVKILERTDYGRYGICDNGNKKVYCLDVNRTNNFFANNFLVHNCKSSKSLRGKIAKEMVKGVEYRFLLTGTPILNRPSELIHPLNLLDRFNELFYNWKSFVYRFCDAHPTHFGLDYKGASNLKELNDILKCSCYFRREKREVLKDLPDIQKSILNIEISNLKEYETAETNLIEYLRENYSVMRAESAKMAEFLVLRNTLRQLSSKGKIKEIINEIDNFIESTDRKLVIFGIFTDTLKKLASHYKSYLVDGSVPGKYKSEIINDFKINDDRVLFGNIQALGTGTDGLQEVCSDLWIIDLPDRPGDVDQVIGRVERSGATRGINVNFVLSKQTIDLLLWDFIEGKRIVTDAVNRGIESKSIDFNEILISKYMRMS